MAEKLTRRRDKPPGGYDPGRETEERFNIEPLRLRPSAEIGLESETGSGPGGPSMRSQFALPKTTRHPFGINKLRVPLEQMSRTTEKAGRLLDMPEITPEVLHRMDAVLVPAVGDRTDAGEILTHVNEQELTSPVRLGGGRNFGRDIEQQNADKLAWKSADHVINTLAKRTQQASKVGNPVLSPVAMGWRAGDFSDQMTRPAVDLANQADISGSDRTAFDRVLQARTAGNRGMPWPGLDAIKEDPNLLDQWLLNNPGSARKQLADTMESKQFQDRMFPDIPSIRNAITDPVQRDLPTGASGGAFYKLDPQARVVTNPIHKRADYPTGLGGVPLGRFVKEVPPHVMFPDAIETMRQNALTKSGHQLTINNAMTGLERQVPIQKADQKWLEGIQRYLESDEGKKYGIDGAIRAGLLTEDEAASMFA